MAAGARTSRFRSASSFSLARSPQPTSFFFSTSSSVPAGVGGLLIGRGREHGTDRRRRPGLSSIRPGMAYAFRGLLRDSHELRNTRPDGPGCKEDSDQRDQVEAELLVLILVLITSTPTSLPLALATIAPGPTSARCSASVEFIGKTPHIALP